jgi:penicillin-binding protein 2
MAGKTGTSQVRRISRSERLSGLRKNEEKPWEERDHALFVAFAPYHEPRYALAVVVEHGGSGSTSAGPIARDIMTKALELDPSRPLPALSAGGSGTGPA